jgi:trk system potassium uptake protein TrkH
LSNSLKQIAYMRRLVLVLAGLCGLVGLVLEHGTYPSPGALLAARVLSSLAMVLFLFEQGLSLAELGGFRLYFRNRWPTFILSVMLLLEFLGIFLGRESAFLNQLVRSLKAGSITQAYLLIIQVYIISVFAVELPHLHQRFARIRVRPALAFVMVFVALIIIGSGFLMLPRATPADQPIRPLDALFTATSAVCVTGLVVRDTGTGFTTFGQVVILLLIQLGGLGIMSLTAALSLLMGRGIGVRESSLLREVFQVPMMAEVGRMVRTIILLTLCLEAGGGFLLYRGLEGMIPGHGDRIFSAAFHAVSAFCNAGFGLFSDSLVSVADRPLVMGTITGLLVVGGLGFGVLVQIGAWLWGRALRHRRPRFRFDLHARVVLFVSAGLLLGGWLLLAVLEWNGSLAGQPWSLKLAQAFFQGATCRTAGFNSMDLNALSPASLFLMIILMYIGGAPGSTAGGVKVTSVAIVWANVRSIGSGLSRVRLGRREVEPVQVHRSLLVLSSFLVMAAVGIFLLLFTEQQPFMETTFEVFSALGTVGLSLGITGLLSPVGKLVIVFLMFVGRLGPLTLAGSLVGTAMEPRVRLPRGRILIG